MKPARQLPNGCGLAGTVDPYHQDDEGLLRAIELQRSRNGLEDIQKTLRQSGLQGVEILQFLTRQTFLQAADDIVRRLYAHVCGNQPSLKLFQHVVINLAARREIGEIVSQPTVALIEARSQPFDETGAAFIGGFLSFSEHDMLRYW